MEIEINKFSKEKVNGRWVYTIPEVICKKMLQLADQALQNTFPKARKGYAVTVLTKNGNIYQGVSYESDTYTLTLHSEATALAHAATHGEKEIIAITGPNCYICKQLLWESSLRSRIDIVIITEKEGKIEQTPISKLMLQPWPEKPML